MEYTTNQLITEYLHNKEYKKCVIVNFLTKHLNIDEMREYYEYTNNPSPSYYNDWVEKVNNQRDYLIFSDPRCGKCKSWISIREDGICTCSKGHPCYDEIVECINQSHRSRL